MKQRCAKHESVQTTVHQHALKRRTDYVEQWICSGAQESASCYSGTPFFQPGMNTKNWTCLECDYTLCKPCVQAYSSK